MQNLLVKMQCDCLDDVIAAIALFRPGPMANIPSYIARKRQRTNNLSIRMFKKPILKSRHMEFLYQEQIHAGGTISCWIFIS